MIRILTGVILAIIFGSLVLFLPPAPIKIVIALLSALGIHEFTRMALPKHPTSSVSLPLLLGTGLSLAIMFGYQHWQVLLVAIPLVVMILFVYYLIVDHSLELVLTQISRSFLGIIYAGLLFSFLGLLRDLPSGSAWLFTVLATTFGADTGAYVVGHLLGRHKLAPKVSPAKTVEGFVGGIAASIALAFICKFLIKNNFSNIDCLWIGGIAGVIGPLGDLSESLLKRSVGVKDSGDLIPGHGGLLDRVDALLFTSPIVYYYAAYLRSV